MCNRFCPSCPLNLVFRSSILCFGRYSAVTHRLLYRPQDAALDVSDGLGVDRGQLVDQPVVERQQGQVEEQTLSHGVLGPGSGHLCLNKHSTQRFAQPVCIGCEEQSWACFVPNLCLCQPQTAAMEGWGGPEAACSSGRTSQCSPWGGPSHTCAWEKTRRWSAPEEDAATTAGRVKSGEHTESLTSTWVKYRQRLFTFSFSCELRSRSTCRYWNCLDGRLTMSSFRVVIPKYTRDWNEELISTTAEQRDGRGCALAASLTSSSQ